jgi:hypothetical protein
MSSPKASYGDSTVRSEGYGSLLQSSGFLFAFPFRLPASADFDGHPDSGIIWRQQHDVGSAENLSGLEPRAGIMDPGTAQVLVLIIDHDRNEVVKQKWTDCCQAAFSRSYIS